MLEAAAAGLPLVISDLACYREWLGDAYLVGTSSEEYAGHLRRLARPQFRDAQGELAGHAAAGYGGQALRANLRDTFELATRPRVTPAGGAGRSGAAGWLSRGPR